jgi:hypothetical protein
LQKFVDTRTTTGQTSVSRLLSGQINFIPFTDAMLAQIKTENCPLKDEAHKTTMKPKWPQGVQDPARFPPGVFSQVSSQADKDPIVIRKNVTHKEHPLSFEVNGKVTLNLQKAVA